MAESKTTVIIITPIVQVRSSCCAWDSSCRHGL